MVYPYCDYPDPAERDMSTYIEMASADSSSSLICVTLCTISQNSQWRVVVSKNVTLGF